jgi:two-component system, NtrC family, response regulator HydG
MALILAIDDDIAFLMMLKSFLERKGYNVVTAGTATQALADIAKQKPDLVLSDYRLPDFNGLELLKKIRTFLPDVPVLIMTSYADIRLAVKVMREGAVDYITKPIQQEELLELINNTLQKNKPENKKAESKTVNTQPATQQEFVVGKSAESKVIMEHVKLVAETDYAVLILGESGTGKEYVAKRIHEQSHRNKEPFVAFDCGTVTGEMAAGEFFGYMKGAFTGAIANKPGIFELAHNGTIFLDEIGNLNHENQVRLLRLLQEKKVRRIGAVKDTDVNVRILSASNESMKDAIAEGRFREDLYHRLNEFSIALPAMRDRKADIKIFAKHFLEKANKELNKEIEDFSKEAFLLMQQYSWPGNLREMKNVVKRAALLTKGNMILPDALPVELRVEQYKTNAAADNNFIPIEKKKSLKVTKEEVEKQKIAEVLLQYQYNRQKTAEVLGIDRKTLYNRMKKFGLI